MTIPTYRFHHLQDTLFDHGCLYLTFFKDAAYRYAVRAGYFGEIGFVAYHLALVTRLTPMRISDLKYLTDGAPRKINLSATKKMYFNNTDEVKMFGYRNETMQDIASAIRFLTEEMIDGERKRVLHNDLRTVPEEDFRHDITIPPAWVGRIITDIWNN